MTARVLVTDHTWDSLEPEAAVLREIGAELVVAQTGVEEELLDLVRDADAILTCFTRVSGDVIRAGRRLQVVARYGIGVDNIDVATATSLGIPVTNVPSYCVDEVAEHALALLLGCARNVSAYNAGVRAGQWGLRSGRKLFRVRGRTLGIVGLGAIGRTLASKSASLGLRILAHNPMLADEIARDLGAEPVALDHLLAESDFVSLHIPLNEATRHLIDARRLATMKPSAFLINTSRAEVVDQEALIAAVSQGIIAGAALDVFEPERLEPDHGLLRLSNVIATPHIAFYSEESLHELEVKAAANVAAILSGRRPSSVVNPEVLDLPRWSTLR